VTAAPALEDQVAALDRGDGILDLDGWILVEVAGADAVGWLNDLVTADLEGPPPRTTVRSLLLDPTGRIRADLLVHRMADRLLLIQSPDQPRAVDALLDPYVLSSEVELSRSGARLAIRPSPEGGWTVSAPPADGTRVGADAFESWRIRRGIARFPIDLDEGSLPAEAGLDEAPIVDRAKGCYLGQESVARVRNLGHPTRLVVPLEASAPVVPGEEVLADGDRTGRLTSVDLAGGATAAIARIRWEARRAALATGSGVRLERR
jgi:hypothetical protein